jgi:hypothetical protein
MRPPASELADLLEKARALSKEVTDTIREATKKRVDASDFEKTASGSAKNSQTYSEPEDTKAEELKAEAKRLRAEAQKARVKYRLLYRKIYDLKAGIQICLLHFGEEGKRISESIERIRFSSWSQVRGWPRPLVRYGEAGMLKGLETFDKVLTAVPGVISASRRNRENPSYPTKEGPKGFHRLPQKGTDYSELFDQARLTERQKEYASLAYEYGLKVTEIARRFDRHRSTVQEALERVKVKLCKLSPPEKGRRVTLGKHPDED